MENSLNTEGKKKKKQAICGSIKIVNIPSSVLQFTEQTWSQNFPKHLYEKKKGLDSTGQPEWGVGGSGVGQDQSSSASPRRGQVTSSSSDRCSTALGSSDLSRDDGHCEEATPRVLRRQLLGCSEGRGSPALQVG